MKNILFIAVASCTCGIVCGIALMRMLDHDAHQNSMIGNISAALILLVIESQVTLSAKSYTALLMRPFHWTFLSLTVTGLIINLQQYPSDYFFIYLLIGYSVGLGLGIIFNTKLRTPVEEQK